MLAADLVVHVVLTALLEAWTQQLDNLVLPLWHGVYLFLVLMVW
jgi:hypothetical protein